MACRGAAPLTELLELLHIVFPYERELGVEHRGHVARIEEKAVAGVPERIGGIIYEILAEEHVDEVGSTHGAAGMARFGSLNH